MDKFLTLFLLFIIYSFIGWIVEIINFIILQKKVVNRGFLIGPYCPIYGIGSILMIFFLKKYYDDPFVLFLMALTICSILEYTTSYLMEKIFKARWWDYSDDKFNINGRICLGTMILFGLGGSIIIYFINPFLLYCIKMMPEILLLVISSILLITFIFDITVSCKIIMNFKKVALTITKDNTEEISKKVRTILSNKSFFNKRLIDSFPNVQSIIKRKIKNENKLSK